MLSNLDTGQCVQDDLFYNEKYTEKKTGAECRM